MSKHQLLTNEEVKKVRLGESLKKEYFYIPVIYYSEQSPDYEAYWHSLRFNHGAAPACLLAYASKVPAGKTLWQAVRHDLENDFHYPHERSFVIEEVKPFDTAETKSGEALTRVLVWVGVYEKFHTTEIHPAATTPFWFEEGEHEFNLIADKYFR